MTAEGTVEASQIQQYPCCCVYPMRRLHLPCPASQCGLVGDAARRSGPGRSLGNKENNTWSGRRADWIHIRKRQRKDTPIQG